MLINLLFKFFSYLKGNEILIEIWAYPYIVMPKEKISFKMKQQSEKLDNNEKAIEVLF